MHALRNLSTYRPRFLFPCAQFVAFGDFDRPHEEDVSRRATTHQQLRGEVLRELKDNIKEYMVKHGIHPKKLNRQSVKVT